MIRARRAIRARAQIKASVQPILKGGCTRDTPRCADARSYNADLRDCCKGHIRTIMSAVADVLNEMGITWWADYGTLLGAVRNPLMGLPAGIIPWDKDADLGIMGCSDGQMAQIRRVLEGKGFNVLLRPRRSLKARLSGVNHTNVDMFLWMEKSTGLLYRQQYISADMYKGRHFHKNLLYPLTTVEWEGMRLPAPANPEAFCAFRYGPNWQTPIRANNDGVRR